MSVAVVRIQRDAVDHRIKSEAGSGTRVIEVVVLQQVAGLAALITGGCDPVVAQVVLCAERVVDVTSRRQVRRKCG